MPGISAFAHLHDFVPGDLPSWTRKNAQWPDAPFTIFAGDESGALQADKAWTDLPKATSGVVRAYGAVKGDAFFVVPFGILGKAVVAPRRAVEVDVIDPLSGKVSKHASMAAGEKLELSGAQALVLKGTFR